MTSFKPLIPKLVARFERHAGLMAVLAFASGVFSFLLVERRETYAQAIALLMLASWVWLLMDNWLRVVTDSGQLIGLATFTVTPGAEDSEAVK